MGYKKDVIKGFSYLASLRILVRALTFIRTPIISRLLTPSQVGVFALGSIILSLMEILTETGINIFLIQKKENIDNYISTAWIVSIIRGFIISALIFFAAPLIANFYNYQDSLIIIQLISIVPILRGFINPSVAKFVKDLSFRREAIYRLLIFVVEFIVSISMIYITKSPVSLVWGLIAGAVFEVAISFFIASPVPKLKFELPLFKEVVNRGKWLTLTGIFSYLYQNIDDLVVGKILGATSLGLYDYAYKISMLPITEISDVVSKTTLPIFVKINDDKQRLKSAYIKSVIVVLFFTLPMGIIFLLFPEQIINILFGSQWLGATGALRALAMLGVIRALIFTILSPVYALQKQEIVTRVTIVSLIGMLVCVIPFVNMWGIEGAAYSAILGSVLSLPVAIYYIYKLLFKNS